MIDPKQYNLYPPHPHLLLPYQFVQEVHSCPILLHPFMTDSNLHWCNALIRLMLQILLDLTAKVWEESAQAIFSSKAHRSQNCNFRHDSMYQSRGKCRNRKGHSPSYYLPLGFCQIDARLGTDPLCTVEAGNHDNRQHVSPLKNIPGRMSDKYELPYILHMDEQRIREIFHWRFELNS